MGDYKISRKTIRNTYKFLGITANPDGSLSRAQRIPRVPAWSSGECVSKDVPLEASKGTFLRIYRASSLRNRSSVPIMMYFHGGGFVLYSADTAPFHEACAAMAVRLPAVVISVGYRLAPEHRLPAAYHDALSALRWLARNGSTPTTTTCIEPYLEGTSINRCFLFGTSAGGNIAYHTALTMAAKTANISPVVIAGLILNQPYFGGLTWTQSEANSHSDRIIPVTANELLWQLALPNGADRDHEYSNPETAAKLAEEKHGREIFRKIPRCLVLGYGGDPLVDRQRTFVDMMKEKGVHVTAHFDSNGYHAVDLFDQAKAEALYDIVKDFVAAKAKSSM